jgi:DNA-binding transcriptional MerR regulator
MATKTGKLYYSIGEVASLFQVNESLLRFWEKEFETIKPKKNLKGTRIYTQKDIDAIRAVYYLVKEQKMTLDGAKKLLKQQPDKVSSQVLLKDKLTDIRNELISIRDALHRLSDTTENQAEGDD